MLNDYRVALMGESGAEPGDGLLKEWRTQEDSNLWPLPSEGSALSS